MMTYKKHSMFNGSIRAPLLMLKPEDEVREVLESWVEETYRDLIDETEFLDSSRVKRID